MSEEAEIAAFRLAVRERDESRAAKSRNDCRVPTFEPVEHEKNRLHANDGSIANVAPRGPGRDTMRRHAAKATQAVICRPPASSKLGAPSGEFATPPLLTAAPGDGNIGHE
jgi:hypothetical protein